MSTDHIRESMEALVKKLRENPEAGRGTDSSATATVEDGLRMRVDGPNGSVVTDSPEAVGGTNSAPRPGWLWRASLASCDASALAVRAAQEGIELTTLEVTVESESDSRGTVGIDDSVPAGPISVRIQFHIEADDVPDERLEELVEWAEKHSPVGNAIGRAVPIESDIQIG